MSTHLTARALDRHYYCQYTSSTSLCKVLCSLCITKKINACLLVSAATICLLLISLFKFYNNSNVCRKFLFDIKWPTGYYCMKYQYTHYYSIKIKNCYCRANHKHEERLLSKTIFQNNNLSLNVLLYSLLIVFTLRNAISSI